MNPYIKRFFDLKCSSDVIDVVKPLSRASKEITESMAVIKIIKPIIIKNPGKYRIVDLCAGNALTSILACFLLPVTGALAIDIDKRERPYDMVKGFTYIKGDLADAKLEKNDIIIAVHPCQNADLIIDIFRMSKAKMAVVVPCCEGDITLVGKDWLNDKMGSYNTWTYEVASLLEFCAMKVRIITDPHIISPKNNIIIAERK